MVRFCKRHSSSLHWRKRCARCSTHEPATLVFSTPQKPIPMSMNFRNKVTITTALGLLVVGAVGGFSYWNTVKAEEDRQWVIHTYQVLDRIDALGRDIAEADSVQRGYALTYDPAYLPTFDADMSRIPSTLAQLRQLTSDNPDQQHNLDSL